MSLPVARPTPNSRIAMAVLALTPVVVAADSMPRAIGLGAAVIATLCVLRTADHLLDRPATDALRLGILAVLASTTVAVLGLVAAAWLPAGYVAVKSQLPLAAASTLLLSGALALLDERAGTAGYRADMTTVGAAALTLVAVGALRQGLSQGVALAQHPAGAFLVVGLALAGANLWRARGRAVGPAQ